MGVSRAPVGAPTRLCVSIAKHHLALDSRLATFGFRLVLLGFPLADLGLSVLCHSALPFPLQPAPRRLGMPVPPDER